MSPELVLIGAPGAGKTTVGGLLAARLGRPFLDVDEAITAAAGKPIADIFVDEGEPHFRLLEADAVREQLASFDGVLALGGGAVMTPAVEQALAGHVVVYLAVGAADAAQRVGLNRDRPLLLGNPRAQLRALLDERRPVYERLATVTVSTSGLTPDEVADAVLAALDH